MVDQYIYIYMYIMTTDAVADIAGMWKLTICEHQHILQLSSDDAIVVDHYLLSYIRT